MTTQDPGPREGWALFHGGKLGDEFFETPQAANEYLTLQPSIKAQGYEEPEIVPVKLIGGRMELRFK